MPTTLQFEPPADFVDPRREPDFQPAYWPLCNGGDAPPPGAPELHDRRCLEFLAAYYRLNILHDRLLAARTCGAAAKDIQPLIEAIGDATSALDQMEDRYAPIGFYGEPVMEGVRYRNIIFVRPGLARPQSKTVPVSSHFAIPGLEEIPLSELEGPVNLLRWENGKVDL